MKGMTIFKIFLLFIFPLSLLDFGIVLGCRIYVKEISNKASVEKDGNLKEGDVLLRINSTSTENMTLKEARKVLESTKERLQLLVRRDPPPPMMAPPDHTVKGKAFGRDGLC